MASPAGGAGRRSGRKQAHRPEPRVDPRPVGPHRGPFEFHGPIRSHPPVGV